MSGKGEDASLAETNKMIEDAPKIAADAVKENEARRQVAKQKYESGEISAEEYKKLKKELKANKYGGKENKKIIKAEAKSQKKATGYEKKKTSKEEFKKSIKDAVDKANKGKGDK